MAKNWKDANADLPSPCPIGGRRAKGGPAAEFGLLAREPGLSKPEPVQWTNRNSYV
jgi:hypothetical protein